MGEASHPGPPESEFDATRAILMNLGLGCADHNVPDVNVGGRPGLESDFLTPPQTPRDVVPPILGSLSPAIGGHVRHVDNRMFADILFPPIADTLRPSQ